MRRTKEEADLTRQNILKAALVIISKKGFEATTLDDVAQAAEVTRGAIYHHFGSKESLFLALLEDASARGNKAIQQAVEKGGTFVEIVTRIIENTFSLLEDDLNFRQVMSLSLATTNLEKVEKRRYTEARQLVESISPFFRAAIEQGELRSDLDPVTAARAMLAYQNGVAMLWLANQDVFSVKKSATELANIYVHGVAVS